MLLELGVEQSKTDKDRRWALHMGTTHADIDV
jgi:hypothetical protein